MSTSTSTTQEPLSVAAEIARGNEGRKRKLLRLKYQRMAADPFAFFRGTDHLFARAWPDLRPPDVGPAVLICGDLHLENFGTYRTDLGDFRYDINDFDEALIAPASLDLVRCVTSILLASEQWKLRLTQATRIALAFLEQYRAAVVRAVEQGVVGEVAPRSGHGPIWELLSATAVGSQVALLDNQTKRKASGKRVIRRVEKHPELGAKRAATIREAVEEFGRLHHSEREFHVRDLTGRIAGVGSLGLRRYLVLVEGDGSPDGNWLLDIKQAKPSSLLACTDEVQPDFGGREAERVVNAQTRLQGHPSAGLAVIEIDGECYRMRQMVPDENRSSLDHFQKEPAKLRAAVEVAGRLTGWSQLRGCAAVAGDDVAKRLASWVSSPALDSLLAAAARYAERTCREYDEFLTAMVEHRFDTPPDDRDDG